MERIYKFLSAQNLQKGFTLVELIIVIAILGVLATVVLVSLDPAQQLARGRDAGRKTTVGQLSRAVEAYYTGRQGVYPTANASWITTLLNAGEVRSVPAAPNAPLCTTNVQNGWCYNTDGTTALVYARLESKSESAKCTTSENPFFVWDSTRGSTCLVCKAIAGGTQPSIGDACNATQ